MQTRYDKCPNCMQALTQGEDTCPYCNFDVAGYEEKKNCLKPFTVLQNKYMLGRVIGVGGFGITYIGWDLNLQTYIAIKEYFPDSIASRDLGNSNTTVVPQESKKDIYSKGLTRYVEEARNLSKFYNLQGIVSVKDFFYENGTGYIVMEYINGINLKEYLNNNGGKLSEQTVLALMKPVFESLFQIHNSGLVHRDISPDNIMVDKDGKIKLIDFGSARGQSTAENDKTYTVILKHGYAPSEQYYAKGNQGPWTDIYSLCATMYKMLTGQIPPNSVERMEEDTYVSVAAQGVSISPRTEAVLAKGLAVKAVDRYQSIGQLLTDLYGNAPLQMGNSAPQNGQTSYANPSSMSVSQQSMYLQDSKTNTPAGNKKKIGIIAGIAAGVVVLIVGIVLVVGGGKKEKKKGTTTEVATVASTTDATTDATTEAKDPGAATEISSGEDGTYQYVWPTELSDDWRDYTANIDGTVYQFPIPYSEWKSKGWQTDNVIANLPGDSVDYATFYNDRMELQAVIMNFGINEAKAEDCFVVGFEFDARTYDCAEDVTIELAGGIKLYESGVEDIKLAFGAPEYINDGTYYDSEETYTSLDYAGDETRDGMDFKVSAEGLTSIGIVNTAAPEGVGSSAADLDTSEPAVNAKYVAPTGGSTDRFDNIISIDGTNYLLPVPFSVLEADGWTLDSAAEVYISGDSYEMTSMEKDGQRINITLENYTPSAILTQYGVVSSINVEETYCNKEVIFPGGIKIGSSGDDLRSLYEDLGDSYSEEEYSSFISYYIYDGDSDATVSCYADPETRLINKYTYSTSKELE